MSKIILGIVADDFSGASDAASFLVEEGIKTLLFNGVPEQNIQNYEEPLAVVVALKTRTEEKEKAVSQSLQAMRWLKDNGAEQLYIKYCSTFDSTTEGNIGPIIDKAMEEFQIPYTILAPSLPVNGRIVKDGQLIVNGVPLHETHMKDHPLTPMRDSDIEKLMEPQGRYQSLQINHEMLEHSNEEIIERVADFGKNKDHFYVIPDFINEDHAAKLVDLFGDLPLLTGGSGLMQSLGKKYREELEAASAIIQSETDGKSIILAGSCSAATLEQIKTFKDSGGMSYKIDPLELLEGSSTKETIWETVKQIDSDAVLVYSSDNPEQVKQAQKSGKEQVSQLLEEATAYIAKQAAADGFNRIIVAGGETSGAVTRILGYDSYQIGESIAPGVPIMIPLRNKKIRLVLKSGNFGQKDFFTRSVAMTGGQ